MKITKLCHSCLLVEMPEPVNRTALFDPGIYSEEYVNVESLVYLDDIFITHAHPDHMSLPLIRQLLAKVPEVRISGPEEAVAVLKQAGIYATCEEYDGVQFFSSPHAPLTPGAPVPEQLGYHYLNRLTNPGDNHNFQETKEILVLPVQAPWGSMVRAVELALELKPKYVLPVHDWHWRDEARAQLYGAMQDTMQQSDVKFVPLENGKPVVL